MKNKYLTTTLYFFFINFSIAQVGVGTTNPDAQLDIRSSNQATPSNNDGILIPKVDAFPVTNPTSAQHSMLVYLTTVSGGNQPGFYYWDNNISSWIGISSTANGDHDWYKVGTTTAPTAITDDMFHTGNVAIGKNTTSYPLEIETTLYDKGIYNSFTSLVDSGLDNYAIHNNIFVSDNDSAYGVKNDISGTGTGFHYGTFNDISTSGAASHFGTYNRFLGSGAGLQYGTYNSMNNGSNAAIAGTTNMLNSNGAGLHTGEQNYLQGAAAGTQIGVANYHSAVGNGINYGVYNEFNSTGNGDKIGLDNEFPNAAIGNQYGVKNTLLGSGSLEKYGMKSDITSNNLATGYGVYSSITGNSNNPQHGTYNTIGNSGSGNHYGVYNDLNGSGTGTQYGNYTSISNTAMNTQYGSYTVLSSSGFGSHTGNYNLLSGGSGGIQVGTYNDITNTAGSSHYGAVSSLSGSGAATKYGFYADLNSAAGGTHYGVYSQVLKAGATNFAGYFLGNVGIGTTAANTYTLPPSRGTVNQIMQTNGAGLVTWQNPGTALNSFSWLTTGNSGLNGGNTTTAGTNFIGNTDNQNLDFRTNNTFRGRFTNLGEFFVGTLNTTLTGDLMAAQGNATFPWANNGYTANDGAATYGQVTSGTTIFAGVQGEYNGTNAQGAGVRGLSVNTTAGTGFNAAHSGVSGSATTSGTYKYGVFGSGGTSARTGGVMGYDYGLAIGALGYYAFNGTDYSVYGFGIGYTTGGGTGRNSNNSLEKNTNIGLGIYGGVMGGWVRGLKYGFHTKGETYSLYVDGSAYTNKPLAYLMDTGNDTKTISYMSTSIKPEVTINGKTMLENGKVFVAFDRNFTQIISNIDDIIITASPQGKSNGIYIDNITKDGFWIYENNDGVSNVKISWIAITKIKGEENPKVPSDLLASDFDKKMNNVMFNENNKTDTPQSLWWDGSQIRWDKPINDKVDKLTEKLARPKETKEQKQ